MANAKPRLGKGLAGLIKGGSSRPASGDSPEETASTSSPSSAAAAKPEPAAGTAKKKGSAAAKAVRAPDASAPPPGVGYQEIPVAKVVPNPYQPRRDFDESHLSDLAESIRSEGLIQPIVVRAAEGAYQLVAGERRWRAFKLLRLPRIPARVIEAGNASAASMSLIENLQRENLNPVEESMGYASLIRDFDLTQEQVAERVGKGRATVANALRLLSLPEEIRGYLASGLLSTGHAKALLGVEEPQQQTVLARRVIEQGVSVRGAEALVESMRRSAKSKSSAVRETPDSEKAAIRDIERRMARHLNTSVVLKHAPKKGKILIEYRGNDDLQRILEKIGLAE